MSTGRYGEEHTELSTEDFEKLKQAPFLIFFLITTTDGRVSKKKIGKFMKVLSSPATLSNQLLNRIITNVINEVPVIVEKMAVKQLDYMYEIETIKDIADKHLSDEETSEFKLSLYLLGTEIAQGSGGFLGFGSKVSKKKQY